LLVKHNANVDVMENENYETPRSLLLTLPSMDDKIDGDFLKVFVLMKALGRLKVKTQMFLLIIVKN